MSQEIERIEGQIPSLSMGAKAKVFGGTLAPLLLVDAMRGGGIGGGILCVGAAIAATQLSPVIAPYVDEFRIAVSSYRAKQKTQEEEMTLEEENYMTEEPFATAVLPTPTSTTVSVVPAQIQREVNAFVFPLYAQDETLHLGKAIDRAAVATLSEAYITSLQTGKKVTVQVPGQRFDPHFNGLFGKGIIAAANQGFGKSILNGVIIEQAGACGVPVVVLDHKGEYNTVTELPFVNGLRVGADEGDGFVLTPENAYEFVTLVMHHRYQAVVNLSSYGSGWVDRARIVAAVGKALMEYAEQQRRSGESLLPCLVLLDEAQLYIPQNVQLLPPEAQENKTVLSELSNAYFALVSNGRSNGYTMCFATQSLTYIAKWAIKSCLIRIFGRHGEKNDLDMCEQIINPAIATRSEIESFPPGVFVVFGFTPHPMVVQFDKKQSRDLSETPGIERLRRNAQAPTQTMQTQVMMAPPQQVTRDTEEMTLSRVTALLTRPDMPIEMILSLIERMPDKSGKTEEHYQAPPRQSSVLSSQQVQVQVARKPSSTLSPQLQQALDAYEPEMSYRDLAAKIGVNKDTAGKRIEELKRRKLI